MAEPRMSDRIVTIVITVLITGVLGLIGSALAGGALVNVLGGVTKAQFEELEQKIAELDRAAPAAPNTIPIGTVVAFDDPDGCPDQWALFKEAGARAIVGVGPAINPGTGVPDADIRARKYRDQGGEDDHTLTITEMPAHSHDITSKIQRSSGSGSSVNRSVAFGEGSKAFRDWTDPAITIVNAGGGQSHNNMPPFIALYFCKYEGTS